MTVSSSRPYLVLLLLIGLVLYLDLSAGTFWFTFHDWSSLLSVKLTSFNHEIFWTLRLPHVIAVLLVGMALGLAGCAVQGLLQNPLADPALLGISSGASFFVVLVMVLIPTLSFLLLPLFAFFGSALSMVCILLIAKATQRLGLGGVILGGVALNAFFGAAISLIYVFANRFSLGQALMWTLGGVQLPSLLMLLICGVLVLLGAIALYGQTQALDRISLGLENARYMGVDVNRTRLLVIVGATLIVSASVILAGPLAFVGLLVPHVARLLVGACHRPLMLCSALVGAVILTFADLLSRCLLQPIVLPLGIMLALIGAPGFLLILWRSLRRLS